MKAPQPASQPVRRPALGDMLWMACFGALVFAMVLALAVAMVPAAELPAAAQTVTTAAVPAVPAAPAVSAAPAAPVGITPVTDAALVFVIDTGSRLYPEWKEEHRVHIGERFALGDTPNQAVVEVLYPHFMIVDGKPVSLSDSLLNPAIRVLVRRDSVVVDSTWAFLNFPPHFSPKSFFTFRLTDIQGWTGPRAAEVQATTAVAGTASQSAGAAVPAVAHTVRPASAPVTPSNPKKKPSPAQKPE